MNMVDDLGAEIGPDKSLLLVDDDGPFVTRLAKAMEKRGFITETAESVAAGKAIAQSRPPAYAVVDLRLEDGNGLDVVEVLREKRPDCRIVVLTGYGAIATAVAAVKIGATDYLSKPADANEVTNALAGQGRQFCPHRLKTPCLPIVCVGNIFSASMKCANAMCQKQRDD